MSRRLRERARASARAARFRDVERAVVRAVRDALGDRPAGFEHRDLDTLVETPWQPAPHELHIGFRPNEARAGFHR